MDWVEVEEQFDKFGLSPAAPSQASRVAVPVYSGDRQVGKATTTAFSPLLKKLIALASVSTEYAKTGTKTSDGIDDRSAAPKDDGDSGTAAVL